MISFSLFAFSGITLAILIVAKRVENKTSKRFFLLRAISLGDTRARNLYHDILNFYSVGKDKSIFVIKKQLPMRAKKELTKAQTFIQERIEQQFGNMRNSRMIKRQEGISEFFKSISDVEKGGGEINEHVYMPEELSEPVESQEPLAVRITPPPPPPPAPPAPKAEPIKKFEAPLADKLPKPVARIRKPVRKSAPVSMTTKKPLDLKKRKLKIVELGDEPRDLF